MKKFISTIVLPYLLSIHNVCMAKSIGASKDDPAILIVSFDGFRYDYTTVTKTPYLDSLKSRGAYGSLINVFETKTFPNHQSLATGLYPENHGVLANKVYDPQYNKVLNYGKKFWLYSDAVTPIWTLNELRHHHSGVMMWPGAEYGYRNDTHATFEQHWNTTWKWELRVDTVISWLKHPKTPVNIAMMYIEEPDMHSHPFSPNSSQVFTKIEQLDRLTGYLVQQLDKANLTDAVNVFILSDHGMTSTDEQHIIDLTRFTNESTYLSVGSSPVIHIFPKKGYEDKVYSDLKNASSRFPMRVFTQKGTPPQWHIANSRRSPPIIVVANEGYAFQDLKSSIDYYAKEFNFTPTSDHKYGMHGYDNNLRSMHPFFLAFGPSIRQGVEIPPFNNVDLYSLWAHMLNIPQSDAPSNGSFKSSSASYILKDNDVDVPSVMTSSIPVLGILLGFSIFLASRWCHLLCQCKPQNEEPTATAYRRISNCEQGEDMDASLENEEVDILA
ncbi:hypothetical protein B566_EDAN013561 [Ephemera danica]|nr:hypothetical protein B566_EDAN013561 [Ephemera danica]